MEGRVRALWRYPVKSLLGERLDEFEIDERGVFLDRAYAIADAQAKLGSGKNTRRFKHIDGLFSMSARVAEEQVWIKFPGGAERSHLDPDIHQELSTLLGQEVWLRSEKEIKHFDDGAVHLLTTQSLYELRQLLPGVDIDERRFRPNILLDLAQPSDDQSLVGKSIKIGETELQVTHSTERCRMTTLAQAELSDRPEVLKAIAKHFDLNFGVYARVNKPGKLYVGDPVAII